MTRARSGLSQAIRVTASSGLSKEQIEKLVQEAAQNSEADQVRRTLIELRNKADGLIYSTERTLEEFAKNVKPQERSEIDELLNGHDVVQTYEAHQRHAVDGDVLRWVAARESM